MGPDGQEGERPLLSLLTCCVAPRGRASCQLCSSRLLLSCCSDLGSSVQRVCLFSGLSFFFSPFPPASFSKDKPIPHPPARCRFRKTFCLCVQPFHKLSDLTESFWPLEWSVFSLFLSESLSLKLRSTESLWFFGGWSHLHLETSPYCIQNESFWLFECPAPCFFYTSW